jgi:predicted ATP-binding protein involved in virulence
MKVVKIKITNFNDIPQLENFEKEINGQNIILLGENGVGKYSVMQFIQIALGNTNEIPTNPSGEGTIITDDNGRELIRCKEMINGEELVSFYSSESWKSYNEDLKNELLLIKKIKLINEKLPVFTSFTVVNRFQKLRSIPGCSGHYRQNSQF